MKTTKHPRDLTEAEADAIVMTFDDRPDTDYSVTDAATWPSYVRPLRHGERPKAESKPLLSPLGGPACHGA